MNKKLAVSFFLLIFSLAISCIRTSNTDIRHENIIIKTNIRHVRADFPLNYYVVSGYNGFSNTEFDIMQKAANDWSTMTNGIVKVNLHRGWVPSKPFDADFYRKLPVRTVWKLDWNSIEAQLLFYTAFDKYTEFCGLSWGNLIILVDGNYKCGITYSTFAHELGHQFGLDHIKPEYFAVMNPRMGFKIISEYDIFIFCYLYDCLEETWFLNQKY